MAAEYCSVEDVSDFMQLKYSEPVHPDTDANAAQKVVAIKDTTPFAVGMKLRLTQNTEPAGEIHVIATVTDNASITMVDNITVKKEVTKDFQIIIMNGFTEQTRPQYSEVTELIEQVQADIDAFCRTTWKAAGEAITGEHRDYHPATDRFGRHRDYSDRGRTYARFRPIISWDKVEVWDGSNYVDFIATKTSGRAADYWTEDNKGLFHYANSYPYRIRRSVKLEYTYGHASIPKDIKKATIRLVASEMLMYEDNTMNLTEGGGESINHQQRADMLEKKAYQVLMMHQEYYVHG